MLSYEICMLFGFRVLAQKGLSAGKKDVQCGNLTNINNIEIGEYCLERIIIDIISVCVFLILHLERSM